MEHGSITHTLSYRLFFLFIAGDSQACYSQAGCVGDIVTAPGPTARDCCAGTDDGESFSENDANCTVLQCVGTYSTTWLLCMAETEFQWPTADFDDCAKLAGMRNGCMSIGHAVIYVCAYALAF